MIIVNKITYSKVFCVSAVLSIIACASANAAPLLLTDVEMDSIRGLGKVEITSVESGIVRNDNFSLNGTFTETYDNIPDTQNFYMSSYVGDLKTGGYWSKSRKFTIPQLTWPLAKGEVLATIKYCDPNTTSKCEEKAAGDPKGLAKLKLVPQIYKVKFYNLTDNSGNATAVTEEFARQLLDDPLKGGIAGNVDGIFQQCTNGTALNTKLVQFRFDGIKTATVPSGCVSPNFGDQEDDYNRNLCTKELLPWSTPVKKIFSDGHYETDWHWRPYGSYMRMLSTLAGNNGGRTNYIHIFFVKSPWVGESIDGLNMSPNVDWAVYDEQTYIDVPTYRSIILVDVNEISDPSYFTKIVAHEIAHMSQDMDFKKGTSEYASMCPSGGTNLYQDDLMCNGVGRKIPASACMSVFGNYGLENGGYFTRGASSERCYSMGEWNGASTVSGSYNCF